MEIIVTFKITGESADDYANVHPELIFEDFVARHNADVELIRIEREGEK